MKTHPYSKFFLIMTLLFITLGATSCLPEGNSGIQAWIDFPRDGASVRLGESILITSHAFAPEGLAEVVLSVNGEAYRRDTPATAGENFSEFKQEWLPTEPGIYTLQLRAYDITGNFSNPATISVRVIGEAAIAPIEVDPATDTPTPVITNTPTLTPTLVEETPVEEIEVATCPPIATALQGVNCRFGPGTAYDILAVLAEGQTSTVVGRNADRSWWVIERPSGSGTCWVWSNPVQLSNDACDVPVLAAPPLPPTDTPTVPPPTPTFTPTVPPPADTTPPPVPAPQSPKNGAALACTTSVTLTWTAVDDPSTIATYYIKLERQVTAGNWQSAGGYTSSTNQVDVNVDCGGIYRWTVRAEDGAGNISDWSSFFQFGVNIS